MSRFPNKPYALQRAKKGKKGEEKRGRRLCKYLKMQLTRHILA